MFGCNCVRRCDICCLQQEPATLTCILCNQSAGTGAGAGGAGALKRTSVSGEFVHALCSAWIPECTYIAVAAAGDHPSSSTSIVTVDKNETFKKRCLLKCEVCSKDDAGPCIQCCHKHCHQSVHPWCAFNHQLRNVSPRGKNDVKVVTDICAPFSTAVVSVNGSNRLNMFCEAHIATINSNNNSPVAAAGNETLSSSNDLAAAAAAAVAVSPTSAQMTTTDDKQADIAVKEVIDGSVASIVSRTNTNTIDCLIIPPTNDVSRNSAAMDTNDAVVGTVSELAVCSEAVTYDNSRSVISDTLWRLVASGTKKQLNDHLKRTNRYVNATGGESKCTPLFSACSLGKQSLITVLLSHQADVNLADEVSGDTPMHEACRRRFVKIAWMLASKGGNIYIKNKVGKQSAVIPCLKLL